MDEALLVGAIGHLHSAFNMMYYSDMRERFASVEQWEVERKTYEANYQFHWQAAKKILATNEEEANRLIESDCFNEDDRTVLKDFFAVIREELDREVEKLFTSKEE